MNVYFNALNSEYYREETNMNDILKRAEELKPEIIAWRRHIHENPEVSAVLPETSLCDDGAEKDGLRAH